MRLLLVVLMVLDCAIHPAVACSVRESTEVAVQDVGGALLVPVQVNGGDATFILDTGAQRTLVTTAAVARLGLRLDEWVGTTMHGIGGIESHQNADPRSLSFGGVALQRHTLSHDTSLTVGTLPNDRANGHAVDGLLGRDFLSVFDLELDVSHNVLRLYDVHDCTGRFLPWTGDYKSVLISEPMGSALVAQVTVDGVPLRALLDTGASGSVIGAPGMARLGVSLEQMTQDPGVRAGGQGPRLVTMRRHRFRSMQVGGETTPDPMLWVGPLRFTPIVDMLLGADWLVGRRVWISYATRQVFFAPS